MLLYTAKTLVCRVRGLDGDCFNSLAFDFSTNIMSYILLKGTVTYGVFFFMIKFNKHPCILSSYISKSFSCCRQFRNRIT